MNPQPEGISMTTEATPESQYVQIPANATERLNQLHAAYADAKAQADEASARLKTITDGIKLELQTLAPEHLKIAVTGADGPALSMSYTESWRVDSKKLKRDDPETYVRYATKSGAWRLVASKGGDSE